MVRIAAATKWLGAQARRRVGWPSAYGFRKFGCFTYGSDGESWGIWQLRRKGRGRSQVLMPYYWPTNPNSPGQQMQRTKFADAVAAWQNLTAEQRAEYNIIAAKKKRYGYWDFISKFLKTP